MYPISIDMLFVILIALILFLVVFLRTATDINKTNCILYYDLMYWLKACSIGNKFHREIETTLSDFVKILLSATNKCFRYSMWYLILISVLGC